MSEPTQRTPDDKFIPHHAATSGRCAILLTEGLGAMIHGLDREAAALSEPSPAGKKSQQLPAQLRFPLLESILAQAEYQHQTGQASEARLWALLGQADAPAIAAAAVNLLPQLQAMRAPTAAGVEYWLRADPVWLRADLTRVFLAADQLGLSEAEHHDLAESVRGILEESGWRLHLVAPHWYLQRSEGPTDWQFNLPNPNRSLGQDLNDLLPSPRAPGCHHGHQLFHELQMLLFQHPINAKRRARGLPEANSLWFWGGGCWPQSWTPIGLVAQQPNQISAPPGHWAKLSACGLLLAAIEQLQSVSPHKASADDEPVAPVWHWCPRAGERPSEALTRLQQLLQQTDLQAAIHTDTGLMIVDDEGHHWHCHSRQQPRFWQWRFWQRRPTDLPSYWSRLTATQHDGTKKI